MKTTFILLLLFTITGTISSFGQDINKKDTAALFREARIAIAKVNNEWLTAIKTGDFKTIAAPYGDSGVFVTTTGESITGAKMIEKYHQDRAKVLASIKEVQLVQEGITMAGEFVYEWGWVNFEVSSAEHRKENLSGRYLTVWKKDPSGQWSIIRNLSLP
jgi:uncharacterized protein (TIGR02246 family)